MKGFERHMITDHDEIAALVRDTVPEANSLELIDLIPIPTRGERPVVLQTIEEALEDFNRFDTDRTRVYLVQIRPRVEKQEPEDDKHEVASVAQISFEPSEPLLLPDGKLNCDYLAKNAAVLFNAGEFALSRKIYRSILKSHERPAFALFWIGRTFEAQNQLDEALRMYEQSLAFQSTIEAFQRAAAILIRFKRDTAAAEMLERAVSIKDLSPRVRCEALKACGNAWFRAGSAEKSVSHYSRALSIEPQSEWLLYNLGLSLLETQKPADALARFQETLALNARNAKALSGLGQAWIALGDVRHAHDAFVRSLEIDLQNPRAVFHLVKCAYELRSYAAATRLLEAYTDNNPVNIHLLYSLAGLQFHLGRIENANRTLGRILEAHPQHHGAQELKQLITKYRPTEEPAAVQSL